MRAARTTTTAIAAALALATAGATADAAGAAARIPGARTIADLNYDLDGRAIRPARLGRLDLYVPRRARRGDRRGIVVYVHGGGWMAGDKANRIEAKVKLFTGRGYLFASVNYRLSPNPPALNDPNRVRFPTHPRDVGEAVAWLGRRAARYGGDARRTVLIGHSAGAHLVALVATDPTYLRRFGPTQVRIRGFIPLDTDAWQIRPKVLSPRPRARVMFRNAFGTPREEAADPRWAAASPLTHADRRDPPALVVTQSRNPNRVARAGDYVRRLGGSRRGSSVLAVPLTHAEINRLLGTPQDRIGMTNHVVSFVRRVIGQR